MPVSAPHNPKLVRRHDGRYQVICPQCQRSGNVDPQVGIGIPITSAFEAENIRDNHLRRYGRSKQIAG